VASHDVVVVGAGPAGLSAAAELTGAGFDPIVIDRSESIGSAWRTRYDSFRLHTIRWMSGLPGMPIGPAFGPWVARDDFIGYLERYAAHFGIRPRLGVELHGLFVADGRWQLRTSHGQLDSRRVVLATGACNEPAVPEWPGRESFEPELIHSSQYRRPQEYAGSSVLVVGSGNSATEVATDLATSGRVRVQLAVRTPPTILRRDVHGVPTQPLGIALKYVPPVLANPLTAALTRLSLPNLAGYGLPAPTAPYSQFRRTGTVPVLDHGFVAAVRSGAITIVPAVAELAGTAVVHSNGSRSKPDAVIAATGYSTGLDPILGPLGLLDAKGLPTVGSRGGSANAPGFYTVGINIVLSGLLREIGKDAHRLIRSVHRDQLTA
jgi:putative flavoprotein involved in K+ transport